MLPRSFQRGTHLNPTDQQTGTMSSFKEVLLSMSNCIEASIASGFKIKKITMLHKDRRDANDTGSMVCLGTPQTSRLQILW